MEINDNQRREVAARLREVETLEYDGDEWCDEGDVLDALGLYNEGDPSSCNPDKVALLADLIDRPTCRNASADQNRFECSECGFEMPIWDGDGGWMAFYFCPNCGAEVVE